MTGPTLERLVALAMEAYDDVKWRAPRSLVATWTPLGQAQFEHDERLRLAFESRVRERLARAAEVSR